MADINNCVRALIWQKKFTEAVLVFKEVSVVKCLHQKLIDVDIIIIILIIWSTFALTAGQLEQALRFVGTLKQAVKKPYGVLCLTGHKFKGVQWAMQTARRWYQASSTFSTHIFALDFKLMSSTAIFLKKFLLCAC